jgi:hypothetical protein
VPPAGYSALPRAAAAVPGTDESVCAVFSPSGKLLAVGELNPLGALQPRKVFPG